WDGRFLLSAPGAGLTAGPLGPEGIAQLRRKEGRIKLPAQIAHSLPALWQSDELVFVPFAVFEESAPASWLGTAEATFAGGSRLGGQLSASRLANPAH